MAQEFSNARIHTAIKKYGSVEATIQEHKKQKKAFFNKYGRVRGTGNTVHIQYVRYADDFILGIVGSRRLATLVQKNIDTFIKCDLHLQIKKNDLINRNQGAAKFLSYLVYLPSFHKKTRTKRKQIASTMKYKRRIQARLRLADARLARAATNQARKDILMAFKKPLEQSQLK